jgi:putative membrane protein
MTAAAVLHPILGIERLDLRSITLGIERLDLRSITLGDVGWRAHPEVWLLMVGVAAIGVYIHRVLEPKAVAAGFAPMSRGQRLWFLVAALGLWGVSDWPTHDVAETYLYSVHMFQHLFISMLVPAMFLLALPSWLFQLLVPKGSRGYRLLARLSRPLVAGLSFNALTLFLHSSKMVELADRIGPLHFALHLLVFTAGLLMWMPVMGPVVDWRLPPIGQCIYLFAMSIVPTVPGGWLVFSDNVVYRNYDIPERLWGIGVLSDQQAAGVVMKLMGGFILWAIIVTIFARWASAEMRRDEDERRARVRAGHARVAEARAAASAKAEEVVDVDLSAVEAGEPLTFEQVAERFSRSPAPSEPHP